MWQSKDGGKSRRVKRPMCFWKYIILYYHQYDLVRTNQKTGGSWWAWMYSEKKVREIKASFIFTTTACMVLSLILWHVLSASFLVLEINLKADIDIFEFDSFQKSGIPFWSHLTTKCKICIKLWSTLRLI